jgi:hypothetical protein
LVLGYGGCKYAVKNARSSQSFRPYWRYARYGALRLVLSKNGKNETLSAEFQVLVGTKGGAGSSTQPWRSLLNMRWARTLAAYRYQRTLNSFVRTFAVKAPPSMTEGEQHIFNILNDKLDPSALAVQDVSGI